jgi:hypothetical protein
MTDSIHADTVAKQQREQERVEFLKSWALAMAPFVDRVETMHEAERWPEHVVDVGQKLWSAIEATRGQK